MAFDINEFRSVVSGGGGLAKNNLFYVTLTPPPVLRNEEVLPAFDIPFFCRSVSLPSVEVGTTDILQNGVGLPHKRPTSYQYGNLATEFMIDGDFRVLKLFHQWMQLIINYNDSNANYAVGDQLPYEFGYKDDYAAPNMSVYVFSNNSQQAVYQYDFQNVYPVNVGTLQVAWANAAEVATLGVGFSYDRMKLSGMLTGTNLERAWSYSPYLQSWYNTVSSTSLPTVILDLVASASVNIRL